MATLRSLATGLAIIMATPAFVRAQSDTPEATNAPPEFAAVVSTAHLGAVLTSLAPYGKAYRDADTTARKDQVRAQARAAATNLINGKRMVVRAVIHDVRTPKPGVASISYSDLDVRPFDSQKTPRLLSLPGGDPLVVPLAETDALKLSKGMVLEMGGTARLEPGFVARPFGNSPSQEVPVLRIFLPGDMACIGTVYIDVTKWRATAPPPKR